MYSCTSMHHAIIDYIITDFLFKKLKKRRMINFQYSYFLDNFKKYINISNYPTKI